MIGYCNLKTSGLAWTARTSVKFASAFPPHNRGRGIGKALAGANFLKGAGAGAEKALDADGDQPGGGPT